ncbi:Ig domain-containing protein [Clostridium sp. D33t1_170424_F3]|uniref:Ig domain-containing protein n=1 Tax=Clostridium sp. D33t1_170424_F3 TaxID=2787099 RepID=UPI0018AA06B3|nr:Ig domain-containing protein [Clostridium sp. D33t1_170424_F3]
MKKKRNTGKWKRGLASLLALVMLVSTLSIAAAAAPEEAVQPAAPTAVEETAANANAWMQRETISESELMSSLSLLPLEERTGEVDLTAYLPPELRRFKLSDLLTDPDIPADAKVAWSTGYDDIYTINNLNDRIDLQGDEVDNIRCVVGSAKQLDNTNIYYDINLIKSDDDGWLVPTLWIPGKENYPIPVLGTQYDSYGATSDLYIDVSNTAPIENGFRWGLAFDEDFDAADRFDTVHLSIERFRRDGGQDNITSNAWNVDMDADDAGYPYPSEFNQFSIFLFRGSELVGAETFNMNFDTMLTGIGTNNWLYDETGTDVSSSRNSTTDKNGVKTLTYTLYKEYPSSGQYYHSLSFYQEGKKNNDAVELAVVGDYADQGAALAAGAKDVKESLFSSRGYLANYGGEGLTFSIFAGGKVFHVVIRAEDGDESTESPEPVERPGSRDTYFRVQGSREVGDYYVVPYEDDTYYYNGFQTVLVLDEDADLSALAPEFYTGREVKMYAGTPAVEQRSGVSVQNFAEGPVQYSASSGDKENVKNYWVTFVKKDFSGPKLYVNGINGPQGARRELFLNGFHGRVHDIFIANVGSAPLTGLSATLTDAQHVRLDDYWTVGGEGNNTLAAFDTLEIPDGTHGELPNVAKVRIIPNGEGEISGTLTIYAEGQELVDIELTGIAGDPTITTTEIPAGVKYVPYGTMLQTNNMYDWNKVTFTQWSGRLPAGVVLKPNGEIYGTPKESGSFTFEVKMSSSTYYFSEAYATFTLVVKENTNTNVNAATDEGYMITERVPDRMTSYTDEVFEIEGVLAEFMDFWLDGEKMEKDADYLAEEGSTKITIYGKTFQKAGSGTHTIAAEFRVDGDINKALKRAAQNYTAGRQSSGGGSTSSRSPSSQGAGTAVVGSAVPAVAVPAGVKYIPYSAKIQAGNANAGSPVTFVKQSGNLPAGLELKPNGELYGVPKESGKFTFQVKMSGASAAAAYANLTLEIRENTNENVNAAVDAGHAVTRRIPDRTSYAGEIFEVEGALSECMGLWLDGQKLEKNVDYLAEESVAKFTIYSNVFQRAGAGVHTLAAEFRANGDVNQALKKTAQNYVMGGSTDSSVEQPQGEPPVQGNPAVEIRVGDTVSFTGAKHYANANASSAASCKPGQAVVTQIYNGKHPYHLVAVAGGGSTVYGWVDEADILKQYAEVNGKIAKGAKVTVKNGAKTYTGGSLAAFVYRDTYTVMTVSGDRVVIGKNGVVTAAVNSGDLTVVG